MLISHSYQIDQADHNQRLDKFLSKNLAYSRSQIQKWIESGCVCINQQVAKRSVKIKLEDVVDIAVEELQAETDWQAQAGELAIEYEDEDMIVFNKPTGLVMYPAAGHADNTLANRMLHYLPSLISLPRAGIVHRLDKDTSGLLVVAKNLISYAHLVHQMRFRFIKRNYVTLVYGITPASGTINEPIGRHKTNRQKQAINAQGKPAITHYSLKENINHFSLLDVALETGRTHQIRVHMSFIGHGVVGDNCYKAPINWKFVPPEMRKLATSFPHQLLHAASLTIPKINGEKVTVNSQLPSDIADFLDAMKSIDRTTE